MAGSIDPKDFSDVKSWADQCFNEPSPDELKMCAINHVIFGYCVEALHSNEWKNCYWCDILCSYVNMGFSELPTVINHRDHGFIISSIDELIMKEKSII